jgi:signal transduction histidine kinase
MLLKNVPGEFIRIGSGLGHAPPATINILPALFEDDVKAVIELASFHEFNETHQSFLDQLMESVGIVLNTIAATMRTEGLLKQSQLLTQELQARQTELTTKQEELHATNEELQEKAQLLENEKKQVEAKNMEIDMARRAVEEKAEQLALTSKYKSEFLANMSHELRTPLNSLLILSKLLATIRRQSQREADGVRPHHPLGRVGSAEPHQRHPRSVQDRVGHGVDRAWRHADVDASSAHGADLPPARVRQGARISRSSSTPGCRPAIRTDEKRLQQVVLNLLSNAFKFTAQGSVTLSVREVHQRLEHQPPRAAQRRSGDCDRGHRYRHRHPRGQAEADLRGVPAGGRHHQPQIWRHRPRPLDQPRDRAPARRASSRSGPSRARVRPSPCSCRSRRPCSN